MIDFLVDNLLLLPFLFVTYVALEAVEARAGGALEQGLKRTRHFGPVLGALIGAVPQCGFSAAAASFYAGGVISVGTLVAVFVSTSDELIPVFLSKSVPAALIVKVVLLKCVCGFLAGGVLNLVFHLLGRAPQKVHVSDLCAHSHCGCKERKGILYPALIHTVEIFVFILLVSGVVELALHFWGENGLEHFILNKPFIGECLAGLAGLIPNCAVSVSAAELYLQGGMSAGALMASSLAGSGVGMLVLFRTNRSWKTNIAILAYVYIAGVILGHLCGCWFTV